MTDREYEMLQERLRKKLSNNPYIGNKREVYKEGVRAAMSILSSFHREEVTKNGHTG